MEKETTRPLSDLSLLVRFPHLIEGGRSVNSDPVHDLVVEDGDPRLGPVLGEDGEAQWFGMREISKKGRSPELISDHMT